MGTRKLLTKNRGEWSEVLAIGKILLNGKIPRCDAKLALIPGRNLEALAVTVATPRGPKTLPTNLAPSSGHFSASSLETLVVSLNNQLLFQKPGARAFESTSGSEILMLLDIYDRTALGKSDLFLTLKTPIGLEMEEIGYSIKSKIGAPSTLLNASKATRFTYRIEAASSENFNTLNADEPIRKRIATFLADGGKLVFQNVTSDVFRQNLDLADASIADELAAILLAYYGTAKSSVIDLIDQLYPIWTSPAGNNQSRFKVKRFLQYSALGMMPASIWDGKDEAIGGYLLVDSDTSIKAISLAQGDKLSDYLLENTKLDTPDSSPKRNNFGSPYQTSQGWNVDLCLQIRFK